MTRSTEKSTLAEEVFDRLRHELLRGDLAPGAKLRINEIASRYGVSPSVLREALNGHAQLPSFCIRALLVSHCSLNLLALALCTLPPLIRYLRSTFRSVFLARTRTSCGSP